ncbi:MAG: YihY family inner membrane protein [Burkholderiaceae bacterium]|nr:YihY family inner membrane protein [Burkholderiaceae bacterium]MCD8516353.1 YihY family inner membrane protein [Burkholderiaceae bacterium]MCD8538246.1 YihY family inner membrane protein [Burkholderiaceae bacterium]MCD8565785.1 YihY family inner membrane protein [Burkholderiaceae bacterium]
MNDNLLHLAASLAFTTILAIVPLLTVTLSLMTAFPIFSDFETSLQQFLRQQFLPEQFSATVMQYLDEFVSKATSLSTIGGGFLLVTAILVIMSVDDALNDIWHVKHQRPIGQRFLIYWAVLSLGPIILGASLWASSSMVQQALSLDSTEAILPWHAAASWLPFVISWVGCTLLYVAVPNCRVGFLPALTGGLVSSFLFQLIKWGLGVYLANFPTYTVIYGAFSVLPTFLMWIYLSWLAFLFGAIVAANLPQKLADNRVDVHLHHDKEPAQS